MNSMKLMPTGRAQRLLFWPTIALCALMSVVTAGAQTEDPQEKPGGQPETARVAGDELRSERAIVEDATQGSDQEESPLGAADSPFVKRTTFTTAIEHREPLDEVRELSGDADRVYFFSEIVDREGHSIVHRWKYEGETVAEVPIEIGGARWRVYSSKTLMPAWTGEWTVEVVDMDGAVLHQTSFEYGMEETGAR